MIIKTFTVACKDFFGLKPGQTLMEFSAELKALTAKDRDDLKGYFTQIGIQIE